MKIGKFQPSVAYKSAAHKIKSVYMIRMTWIQVEEGHSTSTSQPSPARRQIKVNCTKCEDDVKANCFDCGCRGCGSKQSSCEPIVVCEGCEHFYHIKCLNIPATLTIQDDWYCASCSLDTFDLSKAKRNSLGYVPPLRYVLKLKEGRVRGGGSG